MRRTFVSDAEHKDTGSRNARVQQKGVTHHLEEINSIEDIDDKYFKQLPIEEYDKNYYEYETGEGNEVTIKGQTA